MSHVLNKTKTACIQQMIQNKHLSLYFRCDLHKMHLILEQNFQLFSVTAGHHDFLFSSCINMNNDIFCKYNSYCCGNLQYRIWHEKSCSQLSHNCEFHLFQIKKFITSFQVRFHVSTSKVWIPSVSVSFWKLNHKHLSSNLHGFQSSQWNMLNASNLCSITVVQ